MCLNGIVLIKQTTANSPYPNTTNCYFATCDGEGSPSVDAFFELVKSVLGVIIAK